MTDAKTSYIALHILEWSAISVGIILAMVVVLMH